MSTTIKVNTTEVISACEAAIARLNRMALRLADAGYWGWREDLEDYPRVVEELKQVIADTKGEPS